jgi:DNA-directed RNA polymerase subunit omega
MLYPSIGSLLKFTGNRYSLVIATAKRARQIASEAEKIGEILPDKAVKMAINDICSGRVTCRSYSEADLEENLGEE